MAYLLPRIFIVVVAWTLTSLLIGLIAPAADATVYYLAGASWAMVGLFGFGYLHKLRRDTEDQHTRF